MWQTHILFHILIPFIIFFHSSKFVKASSSEEFTVISDQQSNCECLSAQLLNQNNINLQIFIQQEMYKIEKNIVDKVLRETEKIYDSLKLNTNKILDIEINLKKRIDDIKINQHILYKNVLNNNAKLIALENSTKDNYNNIVNSMTTILDNQQSLKFINKTCSKAIEIANNTNYESLADINNTTLEMIPTLNTSSTIKNLANNFTIFNNPLLIQNLSNPNKSEIVEVTTPAQMPSNKSQEVEWDGSRCQEEKVLNTRRITEEQLYPLSAAGGGGAGGAQLRLAFRGDGDMRIFLSPESQLASRGLYFNIMIMRTAVYLHVRDAAGVTTTVQRVDVDTKFSSSRWTRIALDLVDGSLEVRVVDADASTPVLSTRDPRVSQLKYIGFDTNFNSDGYATFKYGC